MPPKKTNGGNLNDPLLKLPYAGTYRKIPKTTIVRNSSAIAPYQKQASVQALRSFLPSDAAMRQKNYKSAQRLPEEEHNVQVDAFIYAIKIEVKTSPTGSGDNDFHVIIGDKPKNLQRLINAEVAGLPASSAKDYNALLAARQQLIDIFPNVKLSSSYYIPPAPIPVTVKGSVYFDGDHNPNTIGAPGTKPQTVWEIHPVTSIVKR
jgi:hypothetical protein